MGKVQAVLVESSGKINDGGAYGRNDANKIVALAQGAFKAGNMVNVRITRATPHQLKGELLSS